MSVLAEDERGILGTWVAGENAGERATVKEVRAGWLYALRLPDGAPVFGNAEEFRADTGETGMTLLERLLPRPKVASLFDGAMRASLAAVYSIARSGRQDTQGWEDAEHYLVDDNGGCTAIAAFLPIGCVVAASSDDPTRNFDVLAALALAPSHLRAELSSLCALPVFHFQGKSLVTAIFWEEEEFFQGPEPWPTCYTYGGEIFRSDWLSEEAWKVEFCEAHGASPEVADALAGIARRSSSGRPVVLSRRDIALLVPADSKHRDEAMAQLLDGKVFEAGRSES